MKHTIIQDSHEEYLANKDYIGSSEIKEALASDQHYIWFKNKKSKPTASQELGTALHMAILEPQKFAQTYFLFDDTKKVQELLDSGSKSPRATKEYKEYVLLVQEQNAGKTMLDAQVYEICDMVYHRLDKDARYHEWVVPAQKELSVYVEGFYNGLNAKVRMDTICSPLECDIKTTKGIKPDQFIYEFFKYGYDVQRAYYRDVANAAGFGIEHSSILAISNEPPYQHEFYAIPEKWIEEGRSKYQQGLENILRIREGVIYDGFAHNFITDDRGMIILGDK